MIGFALILLGIVFGGIGIFFLRAATEIAIRQRTNVWSAARPEFGAALLFYALTLIFLIAGSTSQANAAVDPHAGSSPQIIDIQDSPGGNVAEFYTNYQKLSKEGAIIRLHGYCASACTLILLREFTGIKACAVDQDVVFAFHKPYALDRHHHPVKTKASIRTAREMWAAMLAAFPYDVWNLLKDARIPSASEGDSENDVFVVPAIFFLPRCSDEAAK